MNAHVTIGHNLPDPFTLYAEHIGDLLTEAETWLNGDGVKSEDDATGVSKLLTMLRTAANDADNARKAEKKPHDDAGKAVQVKWAPLLAKADTAVATAKRALTPYLYTKDRDQREQARRAQEAAVEAARVARETELAANPDSLADATAIQVRRDAADEATRIAARADKAKPHAKGGSRAIGLRSVWDAEVTDPRAALNHYIKTDAAAFRDLIADLAAKDVRAGKRSIPGVTVTERKIAA